jgi:hypothetical protein
VSEACYRENTRFPESKTCFLCLQWSSPFIRLLCNVLLEVHYGIAAAFRCIRTSEF